ncbi:GPP34 family phosphoprotein [Streptomonospora nanhaiensis]|uniref:GPP34 family phosphoprotein n=1 Tax=Streptomonospora nanhaiensis TaxID=1323731 RepID=UPI001C3907BA|nr:GPP34 family phosphoprotein [Streptomonospora nanhaiensis]MBV2366458.1 GPP34 family phosphoprotein [Streptomonospora nanhaiensis]
MGRFRIALSLLLFGLAGVLVLGTWAPGGIDLVAWLALWAGAASFAWHGLRALLGKADPPRTPPAAPPAPAAPGAPLPPTGAARPHGLPGGEAVPPAFTGPDGRPLGSGNPPPAGQPGYREVMQAAGHAVKSTATFMSRLTVVLALLFLVPVTLGLFIGGIVMVGRGETPTGAVALVAAGWMGWYCCFPLLALWNGDEDEEQDPPAGGYDAAADGSVPMAAPPQLSLPEEFLLLVHDRYGGVHDLHQAAVACAAAELGELALRRRLRVVPQKKVRLFGLDAYLTAGGSPGRIHLLDTTPTGLAWADGVLAELARLAAAEGGPVRLRTWLRQRGDDALPVHRQALIARAVLFHSPGATSEDDERHYPDVAVRNSLISRLKAVAEERVAMDECTMLMLDLVEAAGLNKEFGLVLTPRQRLDYARGTGAVAALPVDLKDTSTLLSMMVPSRRDEGEVFEGGDGDGGGGE